MKNFSEALDKIPEHEKMEKYDLAEYVFNAVFKHFNAPLQQLRADVKQWDEKNSYLSNQRTFDFYVGKVYALNFFLPDQERVEDIKQPEVWISDIKSRTDG